MIEGDSSFKPLDDEAEILGETVLLQDVDIVPYKEKPLRVYLFLFLQFVVTAALCAARSLAIFENPNTFFIGLAVAIPCLLIHTLYRPSFPYNLGCLVVLTLGMGVVVAQAMHDLDILVVAESFVITFFVCMCMAIVVFYTNRDFAWLGEIGFGGLAVLVILTILDRFVDSLHHIVLCWVGVILFSLFLLYDSSFILHRTGRSEPQEVVDDTIDACLVLFLNVMNLLLFVAGILPMKSFFDFIMGTKGKSN